MRGPRIARTPLLAAAAGLVIIVAAAFVAWPHRDASPAPRLRVEGAYIPQPASPDVAAAYFTVVDSGDAGDELTGVTSEVSTDTMMHRTTGQTMQMVGALNVPAHGRLVFSPGGYHVMIEKPARRLRQGDHVRLTFTFRRSHAITLQAPVQPVGYVSDGG